MTAGGVELIGYPDVLESAVWLRNGDDFAAAAVAGVAEAAVVDADVEAAEVDAEVDAAG